jgi:hypothetical protein
VIATRVIPADGSTLHALIADPAIQRRIVDDVHRLLHAHAHAGPNASSRLVAARVQLGGHDALSLTWILSPSRGTTEVDLVAQIESPGLLARLIMLLGGRCWLRHRLEGTLVNLAVLAHRAAEDLDDIERGAKIPLALHSPESLDIYASDRATPDVTASSGQ